MAKTIRSQSYPRIQNENNKFYGFLDTEMLKEHSGKISLTSLNKIISDAIDYAHTKSSREILSISHNLSNEELNLVYIKKGKELFDYFVKYCGDPASTAYDCLNKSYIQIAKENFRNRTIQKERMNAGWRYQYIAKDAARLSNRFENVSDLNAIEADFNVVIQVKNTNEKLNIYVSVKNRSNTMGGQDWPKAILALENAAINDKNRNGHYICIFGIAMEKGIRNIKTSQNTGVPYSSNTEVWYSDFFWPFFSNYSYEEIAKSVLDVLIKIGQSSSLDIEIPIDLIESFGNCCKKYNLIDENGNFNDAYRLVDLFCGKLK